MDFGMLEGGYYWLPEKNEKNPLLADHRAKTIRGQETGASPLAWSKAFVWYGSGIQQALKALCIYSKRI
jgi:hypothetical protein